MPLSTLKLFSLLLNLWGSFGALFVYIPNPQIQQMVWQSSSSGLILNKSLTYLSEICLDTSPFSRFLTPSPTPGSKVIVQSIVDQDNPQIIL